jgi:hypothetical protein
MITDNYYAVYLSNSKLPAAVFADSDIAEASCNGFFANWLDKEIRIVNFWNMAGPLFRDKTEPFKVIKPLKSKYMCGSCKKEIDREGSCGCGSL